MNEVMDVSQNNERERERECVCVYKFVEEIYRMEINTCEKLWKT